MRLRAVLPASLLMAATVVANPALAQKASAPALQAAPASLPGQADIENAATATRAWVEHVVGSILDGSPADDKPSPPPRRNR